MKKTFEIFFYFWFGFWGINNLSRVLFNYGRYQSLVDNVDQTEIILWFSVKTSFFHTPLTAK